MGFCTTCSWVLMIEELNNKYYMGMENSKIIAGRSVRISKIAITTKWLNL